ncbi:TIM barrel protein [Bythopirellula goksoeyrii]|uniref:TIM barrel protein n=1 Tax=Bythopirellula goksoeyrii TaxID=1400387 RepID=UPI001AF00F5E|nr:TIM barrel protein [Bythopirellula goksoeyrii]
MTVVNGRIKQSVAHWCFNASSESWSIEKTCQVAKELCCPAVELVDQQEWPVVKRHGLICAMTLIGMPGDPFVKGYNNPRYHSELIARSKLTIEACHEAGFPNILAFTGYKWRDAEDPTSGEISREEGADNCVAGLKAIVPYAEQRGINICMEQLNTRDDSHPMKGHPGYQGDDLDYVASIIRRVGSPRMKMLFDVFHVQIMHGDILRRLDENQDILGHVHVAGVPGRGELNNSQEINYPAVMHKLLELNYQGYVAQEFIPTGKPLEGLQEAVTLCDV